MGWCCITGETRPDSSANLPAGAESARAAEIRQRPATSEYTAAVVVFDRGGDHDQRVFPVYAEDGQAAFIGVPLAAGTPDEERTAPIEAIRERASADLPDGLRTYTTGGSPSSWTSPRSSTARTSGCWRQPLGRWPSAPDHLPQPISIALAVTGGVITSAGILLAAVFTVLGVLPLITLTQLGVIVGFGVLLDTLLVRSVLVPALVALLGRRFWWPGGLSKEPVRWDE